MKHLRVNAKGEKDIGVVIKEMKERQNRTRGGLCTNQ